MMRKWKNIVPTLEKSDLYELNMDLFNNGKLEDFLLFTQNFKMMLEASVTLVTNAKLQYIRTILNGEELRQFDTFCDQLGITNTAHVRPIVLGVGTYSLPFNALSKQK